MFAINGRLKVTICIVVFVVTSLGMYEAFRPKQAEAACSTIGRVHNYYDWETGTENVATGNKREKLTVCSRCSSPYTWHKQLEYEERTHYRRIYKHRWLWSSDWDHCHNHGHSISYSNWYTVLCNQSGGDN